MRKKKDGIDKKHPRQLELQIKIDDDVYFMRNVMQRCLEKLFGFAKSLAFGGVKAILSHHGRDASEIDYDKEVAEDATVSLRKHLQLCVDATTYASICER